MNRKVETMPRRRFQFGLRTLLLATAIVGIVAGLWMQNVRLRKLDEIAESLRQDCYYSVPDTDLREYQRSLDVERNLCLAKCDVSLWNDADYCREYLHTIQSFTRHAAPAPGGPSDIAMNDEVRKLFDDYLNEANEWIANGTATGSPNKIIFPSANQLE